MNVVARLIRPAEAGIAAGLNQFAAALATEPHYSLTLRLTLLLVVLHGTTAPFAAVTVRILALLMLVLPALPTRVAAGWWLIVAALAASNGDQWEMIDNHQYLITFWVLACAVTLGRPLDLAANARWLIGIAFTFAVGWKLAAGQYLDGSFFYVTFLTDGRLRNFAGLFATGGVDSVKQGGDAIQQLSRTGLDGASLDLVADPQLVLLAHAMSWSGLAIESVVAVLHLLGRRRWYWWRHASLMTFVGFTYLLLPVVGFGVLLGTLGFSQVDADDLRLKRYYLFLLCFLQITLVPWRNLLPN